MSVAFALMLLAEAVAPCAPAGAVRLPGGATIVRPVGTIERLPFEPLGPTTSVVERVTVQQTDAPADADGADAEADGAEQCPALAPPIA